MNPIVSFVLVLWIGSEAWLSLVRRTKVGAASNDRYSLLLIWVVNLSAIAVGVWSAHRLNHWALPHSTFCLVSGLVVLALGLALRWYSIWYLGGSFTAKVTISADQRLIETGPYRFIRHPSYTGALVAVVGFGISLANVASVLIMFVPAFAVQLWRMHVEEHTLLNAFGHQYREYMRRTKRLIPWFY